MPTATGRGEPIHIVVLCAREWTQPAAGRGTAIARRLTERWLAQGNRVTVLAPRCAGGPRQEQLDTGLLIRRRGSRRTAAIHAAWAFRRGVARDADVALEVLDGGGMLAPVWVRRPRVALVGEVREDRSVGALGRMGALRALVWQLLPLRYLYRSTTLLCPTLETRRALVALGSPPERVGVIHPGPEDGDEPAPAAASWEGAAAAVRAHLDAAREIEPEPLRTALGRSDTARAAALAGAALASNVIGLAFTVVIAHLRTASGYGSLNALISAFLILGVPGAALQVAAARETALGGLGEGGALSLTLARWTRTIAIGGVVLTAVAALARVPIASIIGVNDSWAAAATVPTGVVWLLVSIQRGMLQGIRAYKPVGLSVIAEGFGRLVISIILVVAGAGVTGAYLGSPLVLLLLSFVLARSLHARMGPPDPRQTAHRLRELVDTNWAPIAGLTLLAVLQNIDVIVVKHRFSGDTAGSYAAATVSAKVLIWIAIGIGLYLLPEAARRAAAGLDPRPLLARTIALIVTTAVPVVLVFAVAGKLLLKSVFGEKLTVAAGALPWLGLAMSLLACSYLAVQFLLALGRTRFLVILAIVAFAEPVLLLTAASGLTNLAISLAGLQLVLVVAMMTIALRGSERPVPVPAPAPAPA